MSSCLLSLWGGREKMKIDPAFDFKIFFDAKQNTYFVLAPVMCYHCGTPYFNGVVLVYRYNHNEKLVNNAYCNNCLKKITKYGFTSELFLCSVLNDFEQLPKGVILVTNRPIERQDAFISSFSSTTTKCKVKDFTRVAGREKIDFNVLEYNQQLMLECEQRLNKMIENEKEFLEQLKELQNATPQIEYNETKKLK